MNSPDDLHLDALIGRRCLEPGWDRFGKDGGSDYRGSDLRQEHPRGRAEGDFGKLFARMENAPSPTNPKTSYMAALSSICLNTGE
jgi:hypothetical protein